MKPIECAKNTLQPLIDHINSPINDSFTSKDLFHGVICMAIGKNSIQSISKRYHKIPCETSLRYYIRKYDVGQLIDSNNKILIQLLL